MSKRKEPLFAQEPEKASVSILKEEDKLISCLFEKEEIEDHLSGDTFSECKFENVTFHGRMKSCSFLDCVFSHCDFSGITMEESAFRRVKFDHCRLMGTDLSVSYLQDIFFLDCAMDYCNLNGCKWKAGEIRDCRAAGASFSLSTITSLEMHHTDFTSSEWLNTSLNGLDFSDCIIDGFIVNPENLKGVTVSDLQAVSLVRLLGIQVKE